MSKNTEIRTKKAKPITNVSRWIVDKTCTCGVSRREHGFINSKKIPYHGTVLIWQCLDGEFSYEKVR